MTETLQVGGLRFEVRRSERRKTLGLTVDRAGELVAHAPAATSADELSRWISKKLLWAHRKLALKQEAAPRMRGPEYVTGEAFCYLGRRYRLKIVELQKQPLQFDGSRFTLRRDAQPAGFPFPAMVSPGRNALASAQSRYALTRTETKPARVQVRDLGFRQRKNGVLFFNWKVLQLPVQLVDYIMAHELVHLGERHHSPAFWEALARAMPDWQKRKDALASQAKDYLVFGLTV